MAEKPNTQAPTVPEAPTPQPEAAAPAGGIGQDKPAVIVIWVLYLVAIFFGGLTALAGLIVAYIKRGESTSEDAKSHYNRQISLFWYTVILFILGVVCMLTFFLSPLAIIVFLGSFIYWLVISIKGVLRASENRAYS